MLWSKRRQDKRVLFKREQARWQVEIGALGECARHGFKYSGSGSQIAKMMMKARQADKLLVEQDNHARRSAALMENVELWMHIAAGRASDGFVVQLLGAAFGHPRAAQSFAHCNFGIALLSRIALLGKNRNRKTMLVELIVGALKRIRGRGEARPPCQVHHG